ncbi:hypothetical protein [Actinomyces oricola]
MRTLRAELSKLVTLPFAWLGFIAGLVVPVGITTITSLTTEPGPDTGFSELAVGVLGAIIIGVTAIASEYTSEGEEAARSPPPSPRRPHVFVCWPRKPALSSSP